MPAECAIVGAGSTPCGVLAVGRCGTCGRAFCPSHRALGFVDWCEPCRQNALNARLGEQERVGEDRAAAMAEVADAVRLLSARGVPTAEVVHHHPVPHRSILGRSTWRTVEDRTGIHAWLACPVEVQEFGKTHPKHDSEWITTTLDAWVDTEGKVAFRRQDRSGWIPMDHRDVRLTDTTATLRTIAASLRALASG